MPGAWILEAITPRTRAILINSPCNSTGGIAAAEDLREIVQAAADRGLLVIADETYDRFVYDGIRHASAMELAGEFPDTVVVVGSFSKTGWRVGFLLGPAPIVKAVETIRGGDHSEPCDVQPELVAVVGALEALRSAGATVPEMIAEAFPAAHPTTESSTDDLQQGPPGPLALTVGRFPPPSKPAPATLTSP